jgi:hypothetical protein
LVCLAVEMPGSLLLFAEDAPLKRVIVPKVLSADLALPKINPPNLLITAVAVEKPLG